MKIKWIPTTALCLLISACGGGSNPESQQTNQDIDQVTIEQTDLSAPMLTQGELRRARAANFAPFLRPIDPLSKFYLKTSIENKNDQKVLEIIGNEIVIESHHAQGLYELLNQQSSYDEIKITAHKITVNSALRLPKTKISLQATELIFGRDGVFDTTPEQKPGAAPTQNGEKGDDAREIEVIVQNFVPASATSIHFIANGGQGQAAGPAINGRPGRSVLPLRNTTDIVTNCYVRVDPAPGTPGGRMLSVSPADKSRCPLNLPTNGEDAKMGGLPGAGGNGAIVRSNISTLSQHILTLPGQAGQSAEKGLGGAAGSPNPAYVILLNGHRSAPYHFKNGKDAEALKVDVSLLQGHPGRFIFSEDKTDRKFNGQYASTRLDFATDLYRSGHVQQAQSVFNEITQNTDKADSAQAQIASLSAHGHLHSIRQGLDFYGHTPSYVPTLSLEATGLLFRTEVRRSLEFIALARWMKKHAHEAQKLHLVLQEQSRLLFEEIEQKRVEHNNAVKKVPALHDLKNQVRAQHDLVNQKLSRLQTQLEDQVRRNHSAPFMIQALQSAAAIASVMPAAMPAAAQIGLSLNAITRLRAQDGSFRAQALPQVYQALNGSFEWEKSAKNWNEFYAPYRLSHLKQMNSSERKELLKQLSKQAGPLVMEMKNQAERWFAPKVDANEFQQELARLKQLSPEFQSLTKEIEKLVELRASFEAQISNLMNTIAQTQTVVAQLTEEIGLLNSKDLKTNNKINPELIKLIEARAQMAQENLYQYHALMVRAFEYRLLKQYPYQLDLNKIHRYIDELLKDGDELVLDQRYVSLVEGLYKAELSQIVEAIARELLYAPQELEKTVQFNLTSKEMQALSQYGEIHLDLEARGVFLEDESQLRLADITISRIETKSAAIADFVFEHRGEGHLSNGVKNFYFDYQGNNQSKLFRWGTRLNAHGELSPYLRTTTQRNLFLAFLEDGLGNNLLQDFELMIRPAALTTIRLKMVTDQKVDLENLEIELRYSFR